ncbi:MAG: AAA family ATPase [Clostridiaceae bacterium]|nr:AAA family ATPase [Clostridiaceae bacterium]
MKQRLFDFLAQNQYETAAFEEEFKLAEIMMEVPQNPVYHGEGNVWNHTQRVLEEIKKLPQWKMLDEDEKGILSMAAFFHDIGKIKCTKEEDGRIVSPKHAVTGAKMFRQLCYREYASRFEISFQEREEIAWLIRFHGLPSLFMEKEPVDVHLLRARECVRFPLLYLLGKGDILGRVCEDSGQKLLTVEYFKEYCRELDCYERKPVFANEYTRLRFYQGARVWQKDCLYDETEFPVYLMSGLPLAGKDTFIREYLKDIPVISLDDIREEWGIGPEGGSGAVAAEARERAKVYLRKKQPFVWDATNIVSDTRRKLYSLCEGYGARVTVFYIEAPYEQLLKRNQIRKRSVPVPVIDRMIGKMDMVEPSECYSVKYLADGAAWE